MVIINETPGVCGGYPCVGDTRVRVGLVVETWREFRYVPAVAYRWRDILSYDEVKAALTYYREHPERVDEDIERNRRRESP